MDLTELSKAYFSLSPREQAQFGVVVRAHQIFNRPEWKEEISRRHTEIDAGRHASIAAIETLMKELDLRSAGEMAAKKAAPLAPPSPAENPAAQDTAQH